MDDHRATLKRYLVKTAIAVRYLFLGADTPSYHTHMLAISVLYNF